MQYTAIGNLLIGVANFNIGYRTVGTREKYSPMLCRDKGIERAVQINIVSYGNGCSKCVVQIKL
jgi:hypothetical protein